VSYMCARIRCAFAAIGIRRISGGRGTTWMTTARVAMHARGGEARSGSLATTGGARQRPTSDMTPADAEQPMTRPATASVERVWTRAFVVLQGEQSAQLATRMEETRAHGRGGDACDAAA
jgi:hypothetical protein